MTDPIADYLTRLRNAIMAGHRVVEVPTSKMKREITKILFEQGYILNYKFDDTNAPKGTIKIALKYDPVDKVNAIRNLHRISRPGLRQYTGYPGRYDQQGGPRAQDRRRSIVLRLLKKEVKDVKNR